MQVRPGHSKQSYIDRCTKELNDCVLQEFGDYNARICGQMVCAIFDAEYIKVDEFDVGVNAETFKIEWLKSDMPGARSGGEVIIGDKEYTIKPGFPVDLRDCWLMAELNYCGTC